MGGCCDTENESPNNWEMLSNKGVGTADQWERGIATFFGVIDQTLTHFFWSTGLEVLSKFPFHSSMAKQVKQSGAVSPPEIRILVCEDLH